MNESFFSFPKYEMCVCVSILGWGSPRDKENDSITVILQRWSVEMIYTVQWLQGCGHGKLENRREIFGGVAFVD